MTAADEMCNFYMMYWVDSRQGSLDQKYCFTKVKKLLLSLLFVEKLVQSTYCLLFYRDRQFIIGTPKAFSITFQIRTHLRFTNFHKSVSKNKQTHLFPKKRYNLTITK